MAFPYWPGWISLTLQIASTVGGVLGATAAAGAWAVRTSLVRREDHEALERRMGQVEKLNSMLELKIDALPTAHQVSDLRVGMAKIEGKVSALDERLDGQREVSERNEKLLRSLHDHLLNGRGA